MKDPPCKILAVDLTAEIITGTVTGKRRIGNITSLVLVLTDMAEKIVPTEAKPSVPSKNTGINLGIR